MQKNQKYSKGILIIIIVIIVITIGVICKDMLFKPKAQDNQWKVKKVVVSRQEYYKQSNAIGTVKKWEERTITEKFPYLKYNENAYFIKDTTIQEDRIKDQIGNVILKENETDYTTNTEITHTHNAICYTLKNFPEECVLAINYEGINKYYVAINLDYKPKTLGALMEDLNLREIVTFGTIYYQDWTIDEDGNKQYKEVEFLGVNNEIIWQMLFDDLTVENVYSDQDYHSSIMNIETNIPLLGFKNINVSVSEDGYLKTNIFGTGKSFYIGKQKVEKFVNNIIQNYDGYVTIYVDENGNEFSENEVGIEEDSSEGKIMVYENATNKVTEYNITNSSGKNYTEPYNPQN